MADALPTIRGTFIASYGFLWRHRVELARRLPMPAAALALLQWMAARLAVAPPWGFLLTAAVLAVALVLFVRFTVAWHRLVQFGAAAAGPPLRLRFQRRDWKFLGLSVAVNLAQVAGDAAVGLLYRLFDAAVAGALTVALIAAFLYLAVRLCLAFAAIAADDAPALLMAWSLTRRNTLGLALALLAVLAPFLVVSALAFAAVAPAGDVATAALAGLVYVTGGALFATALSTVYRALLGRVPDSWRTPPPT